MYLILAVTSIYVAHILRVKRWHEVINSGDRGNKGILYFSLSISYLINFFLPIRIGDLFRIFYVGKKIQNFSLAISTVLLERLTDIIFMLAVFGSILILNELNLNIFKIPLTPVLSEALITYLIIVAFAGIIIVLIITNTRLLKYLVVNASNLFNSTLRLMLMRSIFNFIQTNKFVLFKINLSRYITLTTSMWFFYILGYFMAQETFVKLNIQLSAIQLLADLSNPVNYRPIFSLNSLSFRTYDFLLLVFYVLPAVFLMANYFLNRKNLTKVLQRNNSKVDFRNEEDEAVFLEDYFYSRNKKWSYSYMEIFSNYTLLEDFTGLSGAKTVLIQRENIKIYRKFFIGPEKSELESQYRYMSKFSKNPNFVSLRQKVAENYSFYDMPYLKGYFSLNVALNFLNQNQIRSFTQSMLVSLGNTMYQKKLDRDVNLDIMKNYYNEKVIANLQDLLLYMKKSPINLDNPLIINGKRFKYSFNDINYYFRTNIDKYLNLIKKDFFTYSHGDLSAENIILNPTTLDFYFIDMSHSDKTLSSKYNDIAKLKLSTLYSMESIRESELLHLKENRMVFTTQNSYKLKLLDSEVNFFSGLDTNSTHLELVSLYTSIHWLRVISRRIKFNDPKSIIYVGNFLISFHDLV